jgi:hypothetical protein
MKAAEVKRIVDVAYRRLEAMSHATTETQQLFARAIEAARAGEKHTRAHAWVKTGRYRQSIETAARYFVCKWYVDLARCESARDAAAMRLDCLYATALREALGVQSSLIEAVNQLDYAYDFSNAELEPPTR